MRRCVIIGGADIGRYDRVRSRLREDDFYICCDSGLKHREGLGQWFEGRRISNPNTHGTGCTLSSAIAANLAKGFDLPASIRRAKDYLSGALGAMLDLGKGRGPMMHNFNLIGEFAKEAE